MWKILQQEEPDDYVIGTGEAHSVREFLDEAFGYVDLDWHEYVEIDPRYFRPTEVDYLLADTSGAKNSTGNQKCIFMTWCGLWSTLTWSWQASPPGEGLKILENRFNSWHRWEHQVISMER